MAQSVLKCAFIPAARAEAIYESLVGVQLTNEEAKGHIEDHDANAALAAQLGLPRPLESAKRVQSELAGLWREIRKFSNEDLELDRKKSWLKPIGARVKNLRD
jgi:hypothetical protein